MFPVSNRRTGAVLGEPMTSGGLTQTFGGDCLIVNIIAQLDNQRCKPAADCVCIFAVGSYLRHSLDGGSNGQGAESSGDYVGLRFELLESVPTHSSARVGVDHPDSLIDGSLKAIHQGFVLGRDGYSLDLRVLPWIPCWIRLRVAGCVGAQLLPSGFSGANRRDHVSP
jgi:hypothetical protein